MANLIIKSSADNLVLQGSDASPAITVGATGTTTFAEAATLSGGVAGNTTFTGNNTHSGTTTLSGNTTLSGTTNTIADCTITRNDAFNATFSGTGWTQVGANTLIPFDSVGDSGNFNNNSNYNTTDKKYVAPFAGSYFFWGAIYSHQDDSSNSFQFRINGSAWACGISDFTYSEMGTGDAVHNWSAVLSLAASDYVQVFAASASDVHQSLASWGGCRIR